MKIKQKSLLADKIADILTTAPAHSDPADESDPETRAKVTYDNIEDDSAEEELLSKFRKRNVDLLADVDERYAGKKTSRKSIKDWEGSTDDEDKEKGM